MQNEHNGFRAKKIEKIFHNFYIIKRAFVESNRLSGANYGITIGQASVMRTLMHEGRKTMGEMSKLLGVSKGATTQLLNKLIDEGLIIRIPGDNDRRVIFVELSEKGKEYIETIRRSITDRIADLFNDLDDQQLDQAEVITEKLISKVKANK